MTNACLIALFACLLNSFFWAPAVVQQHFLPEGPIGPLIGVYPEDEPPEEPNNSSKSLSSKPPIKPPILIPLCEDGDDRPPNNLLSKFSKNLPNPPPELEPEGLEEPPKKDQISPEAN